MGLLPVMEKPKGFRVVIVGSSVAGLTLGHCLHNAGIEFVILEKQQDIEKEVGATIGIGANGALILDQLGLQESVEENSSRREEIEFRIGLNAKLLGHMDDHLRLVQKR
jgi:2-polyprenyl-6-methoxyphenol hydroxylase-like FAD-dependent oxidoreductase